MNTRIECLKRIEVQLTMPWPIADDMRAVMLADARRAIVESERDVALTGSAEVRCLKRVANGLDNPWYLSKEDMKTEVRATLKTAGVVLSS